MDVVDLFVILIISNQPVAGSIIVNARRECVLAVDIIVNGPSRYKQTMNQEIHCQIVLFWVVAAHISCLVASSLSFNILCVCSFCLCHLTYLTGGTYRMNVQHLV
jgi:hypothetical protein